MSYYNRIKHAGHATKVPEIPRNSTTTNMNWFYSDHNKSKSSREKGASCNTIWLWTANCKRAWWRKDKDQYIIFKRNLVSKNIHMYVESASSSWVLAHQAATCDATHTKEGKVSASLITWELDHVKTVTCCSRKRGKKVGLSIPHISLLTIIIIVNYFIYIFFWYSYKFLHSLQLGTVSISQKHSGCILCSGVSPFFLLIRQVSDVNCLTSRGINSDLNVPWAQIDLIRETWW